MLKKATIATLVLASSTVFSGTMGPVCIPGNATVPCEWTGWDFGAKALYLKPTAGYGPYLANGVSRSYIDVDPDWEWGFMLEGSYHFSTGNDLNLNWYHWNHTINYSYADAFVDGFAGSLYGRTSLEPKWDAVNLEFGQHVDFGEFKDIRFHAGVQYARIEHETRAAGYSPVVPGTVPFYFSIDSDFNGFGPRVGMDMTYNFGNGFAIYGNSAAALLVGDAKFNAGVNVPGFFLANSNGSLTTVVPELEAKLGAKYSWSMTQGTLSVDAGWMWINYFNANHFISAVGGVTNESDFALQGPYVGLKWLGNV